MKVVLYMAISADGFVAKLNDDTPWTKDEWKCYSGKVKQIGNLIIGRRTYELTEKFSDVGDPYVVVVTSSKSFLDKNNVHFVHTFKQAVDLLKKNKFKTILVAGGGKMNKTALESGLVDEIFLDVEPFIFGRGIPLFGGTSHELKLNLLEVNKTGKSSVQLHYKVAK